MQAQPSTRGLPSGQSALLGGSTGSIARCRAARGLRVVAGSRLPLSRAIAEPPVLPFRQDAQHLEQWDPQVCSSSDPAGAQLVKAEKRQSLCAYLYAGDPNMSMGIYSHLSTAQAYRLADCFAEVSQGEAVKELKHGDPKFWLALTMAAST